MNLPTLHRSPETSAAPPDGAEQLLAAACAVLAQGEELLARTPGEAYRRTHPAAFNASIGGHYRHCLDHFTSLLRALDRGEVDYDQRDRDPRLESDPGLAAEVTRGIRAALGAFSAEVLAARVPTRCAVSYSGMPAPAFESTLGRELVYAVAHTIHHFALIAFLARGMGLALPDHFGVAPSTVAHRRQHPGPA